MEKLEDKFILIARSNAMQTPRDCGSDDNSAEFYDPTTGLHSKENAKLENGRALEIPRVTGDFHNYYLK